MAITVRRESVGLNLSKWKEIIHRPLVVTIAPTRNNLQIAMRSLFQHPRYDNYVIVPADMNQARRFEDLGTVRVQTPFSREFGQEMFASIDLAKLPHIIFLAHPEMRGSLYPIYGEAPDAALKRIVFFNSAAIQFLAAAKIDPRILHVTDWTTALAIAYLTMSKQSNLPKSLFTYMDASYPGTFENELLPLLGISATKEHFFSALRYYSGFSLAKLGIEMADRTVIGCSEHIADVRANRRHNSNWGNFPEIFSTALARGKLGFLFHSYEALRSLSKLNPDNLQPTDLDVLLNVATRYAAQYDRLIPPLNLSQLSQAALNELIRQGNKEINFEVLAEYDMICSADILSPADLTLVQDIVSRFSSLRLIEFLHPLISDLKNIRGQREKLEKSMQDGLISARDQHLKTQELALQEAPLLKTIETLLSCLRQYAQLNFNWGEYRKIVDATLGAVPVAFSEPIGVIPSFSLEKQNAAAVEMGASFLRSGGDISPFSLFTMTGGLGQRLNYCISIKDGVVEVPAHILPPEADQLFKDLGFPSCLDPVKEILLWQVPLEKLNILNSAFSSPFLKLLAENISSAVASDRPEVALPKGIFVTPGQPYSLFEQQARSVHALSKYAGKPIVWTVMTSSENDKLVRLFFESKTEGGKYFGLLDPSHVIFSSQGDNPLVDNNTKDLVIDNNGEILSGPNGHGGIYGTLANALKIMNERLGFRPGQILACNIENVPFNFRLADPGFIASWLGHAIKEGFFVTGLSAEKITPWEQMGIFGTGNKVEQVIEYSHPSFTAYDAFRYSSEKRAELYFVRDAKERVQVMDRQGFEKIFKSSPAGENWMDAINYDKSGNRILETGQVSKKTAEKLLKVLEISLDSLFTEVKAGILFPTDACLAGIEAVKPKNQEQQIAKKELLELVAKAGKKKVHKGFIPISFQQVQPEDTCLLMTLQQGGLLLPDPASKPILGKDLPSVLGTPKLSYREGNTNIFMLKTDLVELVNAHEELIAKEEHKIGGIPGSDTRKKIERSIFGPLAIIRDFEYLDEVMTNFDGYLGFGIVTADRENCFEPIKVAGDVKTVKAVLTRFFQRFPGLKDF